jgi:hypothetical protein
LNGVNVGTNSNTYQNSALINGDKITVVMTSNAPCANPTSATSNEITMTVTSSLAPSVSIAADPGNTICTGTNVTFNATPTNGGSSPSYQWKLNGVNVGTNSNTYQNSTLVNGDKITVVMTSNAPCANPTSATSNEITMTVTSSLAPSVSIAASPGNTICTGTNVAFTATSTNGGSSPSYQWKLNGVNVGTNNNSYQNSTLVNGDKITVVMTSNAPCANPTSATSNEITMTVTSSATFYRDLDGDGYGNAGSGTIQACTAPPGYVSNNSDCDDSDSSVNPAAAEVCDNGIDDNCNGQVDEGCITEPSKTKIVLRTYPVQEGDNGDNKVELRVLLTKPSKQAISVRFTTESGTALPGKDYIAKTNIIQFAPGAKDAVITLNIIGDVEREHNEIFYLRFSDPVNVTTPGDKRSRVLVIDDDQQENRMPLVRTAPRENMESQNIDIKVPSLLRRYQPLVIKGLTGTVYSLHITDARGVIIAQMKSYINNWRPGNVVPGLYFYQLLYRNEKGELQRKTGKILITD